MRKVTQFTPPKDAAAEIESPKYLTAVAAAEIHLHQWQVTDFPMLEHSAKPLRDCRSNYSSDYSQHYPSSQSSSANNASLLPFDPRITIISLLEFSLDYIHQGAGRYYLPASSTHAASQGEPKHNHTIHI